MGVSLGRVKRHFRTENKFKVTAYFSYKHPQGNVSLRNKSLNAMCKETLYRVAARSMLNCAVRTQCWVCCLCYVTFVGVRCLDKLDLCNERVTQNDPFHMEFFSITQNGQRYQHFICLC